MMNSNFLVYGVIIIFAIFIVVSIVKKAIKLMAFLIILLLGFSAYNIFVKGNSPMEEYNGVKMDITYGKAITDYTIKIKKSVDNIKLAVEGEKVDTNSKNTITLETQNLHKYEKEVQLLKHSEKLNAFHKKYCGYLNTIVLGTDGTEKLAKIGDISNMKLSMKNINSGMDELWKLKDSK